MKVFTYVSLGTLLTIVFLSIPVPVSAQQDVNIPPGLPGQFQYPTQAPNVTGNGNASTCGTDSLSKMFCEMTLPDVLNNLFQIAISVGAILAMLRIAYAGYLYMGSADMWSTKQHAKDVFRDAIIGLLLLLSIWLILYQINPCLLDLQVLQSGETNCGAQQRAQASYPSSEI